MQYAKAHDPNGAVNLFTEMLAAKLQPDKFAFNHVLQAFASTKDATNALMWLNKMPQYNLQGDIVSFNTVLNACVKDDIDSAVTLWTRMENENIKPDNISYGIMLNAFSKATKGKECLEWIEKMHLSGYYHNYTKF